LTAGHSRDSAVAAFAESLANSSPESAAKWLETVTDEEMRNSRLEMTAQRWLQTDEPAARQWIAQSALPPETKQQLLKSQDAQNAANGPMIRPGMDPRLLRRYGFGP
jgi:hypothetical protein